MKKIFLITSILLAGMLIQAQQRISDVQCMNLQTYGIGSDSLYNGHNYDYYNAIFKKATKMRNAGISLTSAGVILYGGALLASGTNLNTMAVLFFSSIATLCTGIPLWIVGGTKRKNNRKAMEQINRTINISFRPTHTGIRLVLNF